MTTRSTESPRDVLAWLEHWTEIAEHFRAEHPPSGHALSVARSATTRRSRAAVSHGDAGGVSKDETGRRGDVVTASRGRTVRRTRMASTPLNDDTVRNGRPSLLVAAERSLTARRRTGQLEAEVLAILWDGSAWMTPGEVRDALEGQPPLSYSTVMTILRRLWKKGVVERELDGKAFAYHAVRTREEHAAARMAELLASARDPAAVLSHFVDGLADEQRAQLRRVLRHKEAP